MKLHLPKQLFTALLAAITLVAPAVVTLGSAAWGEESVATTWTGTGYEWKGGTGDIFAGKTDAKEAAAIWKDSANWTAVNCTYNSSGGKGPGTADSNMWETIKIDGGDTGVTFGSESSRLITFEGWNARFDLSNGVKLYANMFKWQTSLTPDVVVSNNSVLDLDFGTGQFNNSGNLTIENNSSIVFRMQNTTSQAAFTINLNDSTSTMKFIGDTAITHTGGITVNSTYIADVIANAGEAVGTIDLGLYASNVTLSQVTFDLGLNDIEWADRSVTTSSSLDLSASSYTIGQHADGRYYVSYQRREEGYSPLTYSAGGTLQWSAGAVFDDNRTFSTKDNVVFQTNSADVTLGMDVDVDVLVIKDGISVNVAGAGHTLSSHLLELQGTLELNNVVIGNGITFTDGSTGTLALGEGMTVNLVNLPTEINITSSDSTAKIVLPTGYTQITDEFSAYKGVLAVSNGAEVYIGNGKETNDAGSSVFNVGRVVIESGGAVHTHTSQAEITSDWDLRSGSTLGNKDNGKKLSGDIRFNIQENGTYNAGGTVTLMQHWRKNWEFSGLLSGQGNVELLSAFREDGNAVYKLSGGSNDFSGAYILKDGQNAGSSRNVILELANEYAAQYATIKLNSSSSIAILQLDQNSTIASITSSDTDNTIKSNNSTTRTLTVTGGSAGFKGTINNTITLNLTGGEFIINGGITNNGKIQVGTGSTVSFATAGNQTLGGTVEMNGGKLISNTGSSDNRVKTVESLTMLGTGEIVVSNWNVVWNIGSLNGSGNLIWKNDGTHWAPSVLNINGGVYTGTLTADRTAGKAGAHGGYQSVLQINSGGASTFTNGVVHLDGKDSGAYVQLALNADQVEFGGLTSSNEFAHIFAGEATLGTGSDTGICQNKATSTGTSVMSFNSKADTEYDFKGSVGSGISITKSGTGTQIFSGDTSDFDGTVTINAGTLGFTGTGDLGSGAITIASGAELKLGNSSADAERTLANSISGAGKMTKTGAGELVLEKGAENASLLVAAGSLKLRGTTTSENVTVKNGTSLKLDAAATITGKESSDASMTKVQMSSAGIDSATDGSKGSMNNALVQIAQLAADASFTIADMTLTNTTITAATVDTKVDLSNVSVGADSLVTLAKGAFTVQDQANVGRGGNACDFSTSSYSGFTLGAAGDASITLNLGDLSQVTAMGPGVYDITILLDGFQMVDGSASVLFASDSWLGKLLDQTNNANVEITISQVAAGEAAAAGAGAATGVSYSSGNVGTIITINGLNVPEPTTSTLSLLALAGLCARRRRKM